MSTESLDDEIRYGRDHRSVRIFVSSKMDGSLDEERQRAAAVIERRPTHTAWWWERDAPIGVLHSVKECAQFAGTSDGLLLIVAGPLSDVIYQEYQAAKEAQAERYILIRGDFDELPSEVREFIRRERGSVVTRNFKNANELESLLHDALNMTAVRAMREVQLMRRPETRQRHV